MHHLIAQAAHNGLRSHMLETISAPARASRTAAARLPGVAEKTIEEHEAIAAAIVAADADRARQAMANHVRRIASAAIDHLIWYISQFMVLRPGDILNTAHRPGSPWAAAPRRT